MKLDDTGEQVVKGRFLKKVGVIISQSSAAHFHVEASGVKHL